MTTSVKSPLTNRIIRASAGTGKTFQLAHRFLGLLQHGAQADRILATTFTRKAAGEILERVVSRLADGVLDDAVCAELRGWLQAPELTSETCLAHLTELLSRLYRLRISTLDSFFIQIAQSQAFELGLPSQWRIIEELEDERLRDDALQLLFRGGRTSELVTLTNLLTKGEASRSVGEIVRGTVKNLYALYLETDAAAWHTLPKKQTLSDEELQSLCDELAAVALPPGKFAEGRDADLLRARQGAWDEFIAKGIAAKVLAGEEKYQRVVISDQLVAIYERLLAHATAVLIGQVAWQTEGSYALLDAFHSVYYGLQQRRRLFRFSDITRLLASHSDQTSAAPQGSNQPEATVAIVASSDQSAELPATAPGYDVQVAGGRPSTAGEPASQAAATGGDRRQLQRMAYRLDGAIDHLLLDEFQDTSPEQWRAVRQLAEHVCEAESPRSFFCVGDVKQAIYGWRGGAAEIFDVVENSLPGLDRLPLNRSFRSSPVIMELVNRVFENLPRHPNLGRGEGAVQAWSRRFQNHEAAKQQLPGYACLQTAPRPEENQKPAACLLDFAAAETARLRHASPSATIGVLVRKNAEVGGLIARLKRLHVPASGESGSPIVDAAGVQLILSLLRLADHPGDTVCRFHLTQSPLATELGYHDATDEQAAHALSEQVRRALLEDGYGPSILRWTQPLMRIAGERERRRLEQLVEQAYAYQSQATLRADDFVRLLEFQRVAEPASAAVRVMTIHQSKGLEFDIVVLPLLGRSLIGQAESFVVQRNDPTRPAERVCRMVNQGVQKLFPPAIQAMFHAADDRRVSEALCVLYVALTRAKHALHMLIPASAENEKTLPNSYSGLLRVALRDAQPAGPLETVYELGDRQWYAAMFGRPEREPATSANSATKPDLALQPDLAATRTEPTTNVAAHPTPFSQAPSGDVSAERTEGAERQPDRQTSDLQPHTAVTDSLTQSHARRSPALNTPAIPLAPARTGRLRGWERVSPSALEGNAQLEIGQVLRSQLHSAALLRGTLMHAWFEKIRWLDEGLPSDAELTQVAHTLLVAQPVHVELSLVRLISEFRQSLHQPEIASVLTKADYVRRQESRYAAWKGESSEPLRWTVELERPFSTRDNDRLVTGSLDRFISVWAGERPVGAEIIDFKTDEFSAEDQAQLAERVAFYLPQMVAYRNAMATVTGLPVERIATRLLFVRAGITSEV